MDKSPPFKNLSLAQRLAILGINGYRVLRPITNNLLYVVFGWSSSCVHKPSCSEYAVQVIRSHGTMRGLFLGVGRALTCGISPRPHEDSLKSGVVKEAELKVDKKR